MKNKIITKLQKMQLPYFLTIDEAYAYFMVLDKLQKKEIIKHFLEGKMYFRGEPIYFDFKNEHTGLPKDIHK